MMNEIIGPIFWAVLLVGAFIFSMATGNDDGPDLHPGGGAPMDGEVYQP